LRLVWHVMVVWYVMAFRRRPTGSHSWSS
jgi:hypothetical protein